ncbi:MAG: tRNA (5-methylaminomethyl-2-thiouridine)(34)-methyltransferase MnmD [Bacteroidota bacterium]
MAIKIITTEDGSHSLLDEKLNETYHSTRGAQGESMHVFIKAGLEHWISQNLEDEVFVLEIGFGTGLNAFLSAQFALQNHKRIHFASLEPFPITNEIYENLNYHNSKKEEELFLKIHQCEWENEVIINDRFFLKKMESTLEDITFPELFDVVYFDAFAPNKQPEVWFLENLKKCHSLLKSGGVLITYCAQGQFKRNLAEAGFNVETLPGAMGKKEMVRGIKKNSIKKTRAS